MPVAAEAEGTDDSGARETGAIGPTGIVEAWPFTPLRSGEGRNVRVRVRGDDGEWTPWSEFIRVEAGRSEEHTSELQSLMRISYAVFCFKKNTTKQVKQ